MKTLSYLASMEAHLEAPEKEFRGHRDILTRNLARYHFVAPHVSGALLEVGCGRGYGLEIVSTRSARAVGIDLSTEFLARARQQASHAAIVCASGEALPIVGDFFDCVLAFDVIEHAHDDAHFIAELKRVARPDAMVALSTPNRLISSGGRIRPLDPYHVREYLAGEFRDLLSRNFSTFELFGQHELSGSTLSRNGLMDRIPVRLKYLFPHSIQSLLSVAIRPPLRLEDCRFETTELERAHTFLALCRP